MVELKGQVERITFHNEETSYTVAKMKIYGYSELVTVLGNFLSINPGEELKLLGDWGNHPKYGKQFCVTSYETITPATIYGIEKYLGSGLIKGIGLIMAKRIVSKFDIETLEVIEADVEKLKEVNGIGKKRINMIKEAWDEQKDIREVMIFLQSNGVSPAYAVKIYKQYGKDSISVVNQNPYRLAMDIFGIGFITADKIAEKLGIPKDSQIRIEAGIVYVLSQLSEDGHVFYPYEPLIEECKTILSVDNDVVIKALSQIAQEKKVVIEDLSNEDSQLSRAVYLAPFYTAEVGIANKLKKLCNYPKNLRTIDKDRAVEWIQNELKIKLAENQKIAVKESLDKKVLVITGGPGTGKTTIIKAVLKIYHRMGLKVLLCAPTGRAAKRITETTGHESKTIHRLLEFNPRNGKFKKNDENPLKADLIVVDESSMVDTVLMYHFLKAIPLKATLILVGDIDQLPSVGPGTVLKDIIDSGLIPTVILNEIFRQLKKSLIIVNAHRINNGNMPILEKRGNNLDFFFIEEKEPEQIVEKIVQLCKKRIPYKFGYDPITDIQVLTPMNKGIVGTSNLNSVLQNALNKSTEELIRGGKTFKVGDKVMQIRNNYDKDVYNGDLGRVKKIDTELHEVIIDFDGRKVNYDFYELDEIVPAYAISVHKSQGSEYPVIIMPVVTQHYMLLQRNLLYTGITRGKKMVILIGTKRAIGIAVGKNQPQKRYTGLKRRIMV